MLALFLMPLVGRWKLGHRFNIALLLILLAGVGCVDRGGGQRGLSRALDRRGTVRRAASQRSNELGTRRQARSPSTSATTRPRSRSIAIRLTAYEKLQEVAGLPDRPSTRPSAKPTAWSTLASARAGIPPAGAITLLRNDPKTQGPKLFARYCASCHTHVARPTAETTEPPATKPIARRICTASPAGRGSPGLLDPKQIAGPDYFGNTSHREGEMVGFVNDTLTDWPAEEVQQRRRRAVGRSAAARARPRPTQNDAAASKPGRKLIAERRALRLVPQVSRHGRTGLGARSDRLWLARVADGHDQQSEAASDSIATTTTACPRSPSIPATRRTTCSSAAPIGLIVDWLRGEWYEPAAAEASKPGT